jgi:hypothetical protein
MAAVRRVKRKVTVGRLADEGGSNLTTTDTDISAGPLRRPTTVFTLDCGFPDCDPVSCFQSLPLQP